MNIFKQKENTTSSISHVLMNKHKVKFSEPIISIRQLEEKDINEVRQLLYDHFNSLTLPAVVYWSIQHIYDLLVIIVINYIFFLDLKKIFYFLIIFLIYLYIRAKLEFLNHIRKECPDLENLYKSYINVEGCNFWVAEVFDNNFGSASRTTCSDIHEREKVILEQEEQERMLSSDKTNLDNKHSDAENSDGLNELNTSVNKNTNKHHEGGDSNPNNVEMTKHDTANQTNSKKDNDEENENCNHSDKNANTPDSPNGDVCCSSNYNDIYYKVNNSASVSSVAKDGEKKGNDKGENKGEDDPGEGGNNQLKDGLNRGNSKHFGDSNNGKEEKGNLGNTNSPNKLVNNGKDEKEKSDSTSGEKGKVLCNIGDIANKQLIDSRRNVPFRFNDFRRNIFNTRTNDDEDSNFLFVNRKIVGCVGIVPFKGDNSIAQLVRMVVKKDNRRMRIGSRLLTQLENFAHEQNYQELKVFTNNLNTDSLYFVKQNGFNLSQIVRRGLMRGDLLIWSKILNKDDFYKFNSPGNNKYVKSMNLGEY
ncbi:N-acetyltransferase [Plasmodium ovale curtisi]|uniref:N-acetyltransferase n=2 Tax=Plasmodium ovale curtisi TaxID=864141 RepID=A0A1A8X160_PLAOA|nr:N-acetyltransferase [Plasmodium ovale curtisi]